MTPLSNYTHRRQVSFGFFAGPIAWVLQLVIGYALSTVSCSVGSKLPVYVLSALAVLVTIGAGIAAWRSWRELRTGRPTLSDMVVEHESAEFLAIAGFLISGIFFLLTVLTGLSGLFLTACPIITMPLP